LSYAHHHQNKQNKTNKTKQNKTKQNKTKQNKNNQTQFFLRTSPTKQNKIPKHNQQNSLEALFVVCTPPPKQKKTKQNKTQRTQLTGGTFRLTHTTNTTKQNKTK